MLVDARLSENVEETTPLVEKTNVLPVGEGAVRWSPWVIDGEREPPEQVKPSPAKLDEQRRVSDWFYKWILRYDLDEAEDATPTLQEEWGFLSERRWF